MKFCYFLLVLLNSICSFSQDVEPHNLKVFGRSPFKKEGSVVDCPRDWMMPRERMDSLKQEVKRLDEKILSLSEVAVDLHSGMFVQLFVSEYEITSQPWGEVREFFCVSDSEAGKLFRISDMGEVSFDQIKVYEGKYLVITNEYYYLGNCERLTTDRKYYIRK